MISYLVLLGMFVHCMGMWIVFESRCIWLTIEAHKRTTARTPRPQWY